MTCEVIQSTCMRVGGRAPIVLDFTAVASRTWRHGALYGTGVRVRPTRYTGFEFEPTTGGQSGLREPRWPKVIGGTVPDGSIVWTARAVSTASLKKTLASVTWEVPSSFTVSGESIDTTAQTATAYLEPATAGDYQVIAWATFSDAPAQVEGFAIAIEVV